MLSRLFPNIGKLSCLKTLSFYIVSLEKGTSLAELRDLNLGGRLSIEHLNNVGSFSDAEEANLLSKKDLQELWLSWIIPSGDFNKTPTINDEQLLEVLQPHSNLKRHCKNCGRLLSCDGMEVGIFPSLEELVLQNLPNIEGLLKVERGEMFACLSELEIISCPKLGLPCLPSLKYLRVEGCNNELLRSISTFGGLITKLTLSGGEGITSFPEGMFTNLTFLQNLTIENFPSFPKLKELPNEPFNLALDILQIHDCDELESLPEQI
ncbi:NBS-LRR resistance protein, partial [Trifolium medium]|nr:NBS-LRR resistance protein [Trifolium medium]